MTVVYDMALRCDFRREGRDYSCGGELVGCAGGVSLPSKAEARSTAAENGWVVAHGPSSCRYDLCPDHAQEVPGGTFPDWIKPA